MTTDRKALIEELEFVAENYPDVVIRARCLKYAQAICDLEAENEVLRQQLDASTTLWHEANAEVARLKALGDGLKGYAVHNDDCRVNSWSGYEPCTCGLSVTLAAWEGEMPYRAPEKPEELIKEVKIQIGEEWISHRWGKGIAREAAMQRARQMLESLA